MGARRTTYITEKPVVYSDQSPSRAPRAATRSGAAALQPRAACVSSWLGEPVVEPA